MKTTFLLSALLVATAACGDDAGGTGDDIMIDMDAAPPGVCNPLAQSGCASGEKCTWIQASEDIGFIGCTADGATAAGASCTRSAENVADTCVKGTVCLSGECKNICDPDGGAPACDANHSCSTYDGLFDVSGTNVAGVCDPGCDPLTQELKVGTNKAACGSTDPAAPQLGCYGYDDYSCAPVPTGALVLTDRKYPLMSASGSAYINGCAPGYLPMWREETASAKSVCAGFCYALEADNSKTTAPGYTGPATGAPAALVLGDPTKMAKLPTSALAVGNGTCAADKKGSEASSQCQFMWPYAQDDTTGELPVAFQANYADTLGVCIAISHYKYDANVPADMIPETDLPSCSNLPPRSAATPGTNDDAMDWGCYSFTTTDAANPFNGKKFKKPNTDMRMSTPTTQLAYRHPLI